MSKSEEILSRKREGDRKDAEKALSIVGGYHPASKYIRSILKALDHRPPTKRERNIVRSIVSPVTKTLEAPCLRCSERSSETLSIIIGFPVCESCYQRFEDGFSNLSSTDLDVDFSEPKKISTRVMKTEIEEMDLDI